MQEREVGFGTFLAAVYCACLVALVATGALLLAGYGGEYVVEAVFGRPRTFAAVVLTGGVVVGLAAWSSRTQWGAARRALAAGLLLSVLALAWIPVRAGPLAPDFDAGRFTEAVAAGDGAEIRRQGRLLRAEDTLPGLREAAVVRRLGPPDVRGRRWWSWGVTSEGAVRVRFGRGLAERVEVVGDVPD